MDPDKSLAASILVVAAREAERSADASLVANIWGSVTIFGMVAIDIGGCNNLGAVAVVALLCTRCGAVVTEEVSSATISFFVLLLFFASLFVVVEETLIRPAVAPPNMANANICCEEGE